LCITGQIKQTETNRNKQKQTETIRNKQEQTGKKQEQTAQTGTNRNKQEQERLISTRIAEGVHYKSDGLLHIKLKQYVKSR